MQVVEQSSSTSTSPELTQSKAMQAVEQSSPTRTSPKLQSMTTIQQATAIDSPSPELMSKLASKIRLIDGAITTQQEKTNCNPPFHNRVDKQACSSNSGSASYGLNARIARGSKC